MLLNIRKAFILCSVILAAVSRGNFPIIEDNLLELVRENEDEPQFADIFADGSIDEAAMGHEGVLSHRSLIQTIIYHLYRKMRDLQILWLIDGDVLADIVTVGTEKEQYLEIGVTHLVGREYHRYSAGHRPLEREYRPRANNLPFGETHTRVADVQNHTLVSFLHGFSDYLPGLDDSTRLCEAMCRNMIQKFQSNDDIRALTPVDLTQDAWYVTLQARTGPGCFMALTAIINPWNEIMLSNLGMTWAGLFRNEELIAETRPQGYEDGVPAMICSLDDDDDIEFSEINVPNYSLPYLWDAKEGDVFVIVSEEVRRFLKPEAIRQAFPLIKTLGTAADPFRGEDDFDLVGMGIAKAAQLVAGDDQLADFAAVAIEIGPAREE